MDTHLIKGLDSVNSRSFVRPRSVAAATALCLAFAAAACSKASNTSADAGAPINVGLMVPLTGSAAASFAGGATGVKARVEEQNAKGGVKGHKINLIQVDDHSTAAGALTAAQLLVQKDHVLGIIEVSNYTNGAARFLQQNHVPIVGPGSDGPEWSDPSYNNMFPSYGSFNPKYVAPSTFGTFFKSQGVTKFASVGFNALAGQGSVHEANESVKAAGIPVVYTNTSSPVGSTDFGAISLALKASGADGLFLGMPAVSNIALVTALKQAGANIPVILGPGYGSDTLSSQPSVTAMQGVYFLSWAETQSDNDSATQDQQAALAKYENFTLPPGSHVEQGWFSAEEFIEGLQNASALTSAAFITYMRSAKTNAGGMFGTHKLDFSQYGNVAQGTGPDNCLWITKLSGNTFTAVSGADPVCGTLIPGTEMQTS